VGEHVAEVSEDRSGNIVTKNPNAAVALGSGSGLGGIVIWIAQSAGAGIPPEIAALVGGAIAAVALFIGRNGLYGVVGFLKFGSKGKRPSG
jgi:hypothetical protein